MTSRIHRVNAADLPAALKNLKVTCGQMPTEGEWAIHMPLPKRSIEIFVVDPVLLCAGQAISTFKIEDVEAIFEAEGWNLPKKAVVLKLTAVPRRKSDAFYDDKIQVTLAPSKEPQLLVFASRTRLGHTKAFFSRREAEAYAADLVKAAAGALKQAA